MLKRFIAISVVMLIFATPLYALTLPPVPTEPIYFEPPVAAVEQQQRELGCYQLDKAINQLHPYRYSYKPSFYQDGSNQLATALIVFDNIPVVEGWLGLGYLGYSALVGEKEDRRMLQVEQQIAALQRVKAEKHCYE
jgi:hypothetical protein